jgi:hypothetical protein
MYLYWYEPTLVTICDQAGREMYTAEQDQAEVPRVPLEITRLSKFPFGVEEDTEGALETVLIYLPVQARAWTLYETFIEHASWMFCPLKREEMVEEIITPIYKAMKERQTSGSKAIQSISPHKLAVLFLLFAIGALVDLTQEACEFLRCSMNTSSSFAIYIR